MPSLVSTSYWRWTNVEKPSCALGEVQSFLIARRFCRVEHYFSAKGERIIHGRVRVRLHGPNFAVRFFDRIVAPDEGRATKALDASLYLKRETLLGHWNGKFLIAQLAEAAKLGHYAHCYFLGRIKPHPVAIARLIAVVESLDYLAFTVRRTAAGLAGGNSEVVSRQTRTDKQRTIPDVRNRPGAVDRVFFLKADLQRISNEDGDNRICCNNMWNRKMRRTGAATKHTRRKQSTASDYLTRR